MKKRKLSNKRNPKDRTNTMLMMLVSIFVLTLTVGYAALNKEVKISSEGTFKVEQDIRITDLRIDEVQNTALENYENDYAKDSIKVGVTLPEINSNISYKVEVTNTGTVAQWIDSIEDLVNNNSDMEYKLEGMTTRQLIYPGEVKEFDIRIKYKEGITITNNTIDLLIKLNFVKPVSVLAQGSNSGATSTFFNSGPITKQEVETIEFLPTLDVGENAIGSWDASYEKNGTVIAWYTDTDSDNLYELYIGGIGEVQTPVNASYLFYNFNKIASIDFNNYINTENTINMASLFLSCSSLTSLDVTNFNTENVTSMNGMFYNCSLLTNLDLSSFNTAKVTSMTQMFYNCSSLTSLDVTNFNTENVTTMTRMFYNCSSLTSLDVANFNTENVAYMSGMFYDCSSLTSLNLTNFNTGKVTIMSGMFYDCSSLTSLDVANFNTENVTNMSGMFYDCSSLTSLNLANFNTVKATNMSRLFYNCSKLTELDIRNFDFTAVSSSLNIFTNVPSSSLITVKDKTSKNWILDKRSDFTNVKTLEEL